MSVYVGAAEWPFGRMMMCHCMADTTEELLAMMDAVGVQRKWIQKQGTPYEHFDICKSKRTKAVVLGAIEVDHAGEVAVWRGKADGQSQANGKGTGKMSEWILCSTELPPNGKEVLTKIDDERGSRNETTLKRQGRLWFFPDMSMYVYYTPTHWKERGQSQANR